MSQIQGNRELQCIERVQVLSKAVLLEKSVGLLKMALEHAHDFGSAPPNVGEKPPSQEPKVRSRNDAASYLLCKDRHAFHDAQPRYEESCASVSPQAIYL